MKQDDAELDRKHPLLRGWSSKWMRFRNIAVPSGKTWEQEVARIMEADARAYGGGYFGHAAFFEADMARSAEYHRRNSDAVAALEHQRQQAGRELQRQQADAGLRHQSRDGHARAAEQWREKFFASQDPQPEPANALAHSHSPGRGRSR